MEVLSTSVDFCVAFLPTITPADAKRIEALHYHHHGIRGMIHSFITVILFWETVQLCIIASFKKGGKANNCIGGHVSP
jgi:hypothetical protein